MDVKQKQFFILKLLNNIMGPVMYRDVVDLGKNFQIESSVDLYVVSREKHTYLNYFVH